jgi:hypothetical protein
MGAAMKTVLHLAWMSALAANLSFGNTAVMPDFGDTVPGQWVADRYDPTTFALTSAYGFNDVLDIGISSADSAQNRPAPYDSSFYNTQGRGFFAFANAPANMGAYLYVPDSWADGIDNGFRRTDMWGVMADSGGEITDYPIIGFTNQGGAGRFRIWSDVDGGSWTDLSSAMAPVQYGAWNHLEMEFTGTAFEYYVNGTLAYKDTDIMGSVAFSEVLLQAYNFGSAYGLDTANGQQLASALNYDAYWASNTPEPRTCALWGGGLLVLMAGLRRRGRIRG